MVYKDKTFCDGNGCQAFKTCDRALTPEIEQGAKRYGMMISTFMEPAKLSCYLPSNDTTVKNKSILTSDENTSSQKPTMLAP
jgi:hypothetical protein